jgi:hypothetical protein
MGSLLLKSAGIWFVIFVAAVLNGTLREKVLMPAMGKSIALPLSGAILAVLVFLMTLLLVPLMGRKDGQTFLGVGVFWVILTLSLEILFGHFVAGKPWSEIWEVFNVMKGDLFVLVLFVTAVSPWLTAKIRGLI